MRIACVTTAKGRTHHLKSTLPKNIRDRGRSDVVFILLDYNDTEELGDYIKRYHKDDIAAGRLVYYRNEERPRFHMAHAKNMAHRCAMLEGAELLVTMDADNFGGPGFSDYLQAKFAGDPALSYICPDFKTLPPRGQRFNVNDPTKLGRGFAGRLAIRTQDFVKVGGYNEIFATWRGEDLDLLARLKRLGVKSGAMDPMFLHAIAHSTEVRFKEYPEAEEFENDSIFEIIEKAHDTVVNFGKFGCGTVYRNFSKTPITLAPLPTRVFGIGMQRTGTTSLHEAFKLLGFDSAHWKSGEWSRTIWQEMNKWGRSRLLEQDYALSDNPFPMLYQKLDKAYPGSKFVLTVRDEDSWLASIKDFWTYDHNPRRWTWDIDGFTHKMHGITYGVTEFNEAIFRERYRRHNAEVREYFAGRSDLLQLDINERATMGPLCEFLGVPVVNDKFPHHNKGGRDTVVIDMPIRSVKADPFPAIEEPIEEPMHSIAAPGILIAKRRQKDHHYRRARALEIVTGSLVIVLVGLGVIAVVLM